MTQNDTIETISLQTDWLGRSWSYFPEIGSTNRWLKENQARLPHGTVAITDYQNAGKGRHGRTWTTPPRTAILHSLLLKPDWPTDRAPWLTMIAGLAAVRALQTVTAVPVQLKWPNDVIVVQPDDTLRKLGGILIDADLAGETIQQVIIGIGLNINLGREDLPSAVTPPTSVLIETGQTASRPAVVAELLTQFEMLYTQADQGISPHAMWESQIVNLHQPVTVTYLYTSEQLTGFAVGTNDWGHLLVRDEAGKTHEISAGDVTLRPLRE